MNIDMLLKKRATDLDNMPDEEYQWLVDHVGHFSTTQLLCVLKTGRADALREIARDELLARNAAIPHWTLVPTFWLVVVGTIAGIAAVIMAWMFRPPLSSSNSPTPAPPAITAPANSTPTQPAPAAL